MRERGSATILALALLLMIVAVGLAIVAATQIVTARTRAVIAADAAALAAAPMTFPPLGVQTPLAAAIDFAAANGAVVTSCSCPVVDTFDPRSVEVEVRLATHVILVGDVAVSAVSRAEFVP
ncbi:MAG: Rv3654c family TadE-like protein [Acidimicrobiia bacterium]